MQSMSNKKQLLLQLEKKHIFLTQKKQEMEAYCWYIFIEIEN